MGVAVGTTLLLLVATSGLLRHRSGTSDVIVADGSWAGVLAGLGGLAWAFMQISSTRADNGYRHRGLPGLLALVVPAATGVNVAAMTLWPLLVEGHAAPDELVATMLTEPLSLLLAGGYVFAMSAWGATCALGFVRGGWRSSLALVPVLLTVIGVGGWRGVVIFTNQPSVTAVVVWGAIAVASLGVLMMVAAGTSSRSGDTRSRPVGS